MKQQGFDFASPEPMPAHYPTGINPRDPNVDATDVKRLAGQNGRLLEMLRSRREVTNLEMVAEGILRYTNRISDLRNAGYAVNLMRRVGGTSWYSLEEARP